jgi:hypothetical protein
MKLGLIFPLLLLTACPGAPTSSAADAGATGDLGTQVCNHLTTIGCPQPATCPHVLNTQQGVITDFKPACLLNAQTLSQANDCGTIHCP